MVSAIRHVWLCWGRRKSGPFWKIKDCVWYDKWGWWTITTFYFFVCILLCTFRVNSESGSLNPADWWRSGVWEWVFLAIANGYVTELSLMQSCWMFALNAYFPCITHFLTNRSRNCSCSRDSRALSPSILNFWKLIVCGISTDLFTKLFAMSSVYIWQWPHSQYKSKMPRAILWYSEVCSSWDLLIASVLHHDIFLSCTIYWSYVLPLDDRRTNKTIRA